MWKMKIICIFNILSLVYSFTPGFTNSKRKILNSPDKTHKLALDNYKLVPYFAKPYIKKHSLNRERSRELIQEGYLGFLKPFVQRCFFFFRE